MGVGYKLGLFSFDSQKPYTQLSSRVPQTLRGMGRTSQNESCPHPGRKRLPEKKENM